MTPTELQTDIRLALGRLPGVRLFRNTVGEGWVGKLVRREGGALLLDRARAVTFGLQPGSHDLIGWRTITVTPDMVGKPIAVFTSLEVKSGKGRMFATQRDWYTAVSDAGGIAATVRSPDDALAAVGASR